MLTRILLFYTHERNGTWHIVNKIMMIPEHQSMQVQQPHQMSNMEQVLLVGIYLDHRLEHHQHLSIPV